MFKHKDKNGKSYKLSELDDSHLNNIIRRIEKLSIEGLTIMYGGGGVDADDIWYDEEILFGQEAKNAMDYHEYIKERKRREKLSF